jgi:hypothetical protein
LCLSLFGGSSWVVRHWQQHNFSRCLNEKKLPAISLPHFGTELKSAFLIAFCSYHVLTEEKEESGAYKPTAAPHNQTSLLLRLILSHHRGESLQQAEHSQRDLIPAEAAG